MTVEIMKTLKSGDVVKIDPHFPFIDRTLFDSEVCVIDKMIDSAGIVTIRGHPKNKTFSVNAFDLITPEDTANETSS